MITTGRDHMIRKYWRLSGGPLNTRHLQSLLSTVRSCWMKDHPGVTADQIRDWEISVSVEAGIIVISYIIES